jgi:hypothetical protein
MAEPTPRTDQDDRRGPPTLTEEFPISALALHAHSEAANLVVRSKGSDTRPKMLLHYPDFSFSDVQLIQRKYRQAINISTRRWYSTWFS